MSKEIVRSLLAVCLIMTVSCSPSSLHTLDASDSDASKLAPPNDEDSEFHPPPEDNDTNQSAPVIIGPTPYFCSKLDLAGVTWPIELASAGQAHLALALNISGSFEGRSGWANLSNNFDGMGFSIGLLQQNLGMGSLQPLLNELIAAKGQGGVRLNMDEASYVALKAMVSQWNKDQSVKAKIGTSFLSESNGNENSPFLNDDKNISQYDSDYDAPVLEVSSDLAPLEANLSTKSVASANKKSVSWALTTVYSDGGKTFKSDWAKNLTNMAQSKPYVSLQLKYAMKLYNQAFRYFQAFKLSTLSHFLLMFDFVVQNGGFKQRVFDDYALKLKQQPNLSDQDKVLLILQLRLRDVSARWQNDVRARKRTIIFSKGIVHGAKRDLKSEYCYNPSSPLLTQP
jgi:hypothetical protein